MKVSPASRRRRDQSEAGMVSRSAVPEAYTGAVAEPRFIGLTEAGYQTEFVSGAPCASAAMR